MEKWINQHNKLLTLLFAILALGISFFSFLKSCSTETELERTNYTISSIEHRPKLKLSNPQIQALTLTTDSIPLKSSTDEADSIGTLLMKIEIQARIQVTNIGNSTSKIVGWAICDTLSTEPILNQFIKKRQRNNKETKNDLKFPHLYQELSPTESCDLALKYSPQWINGNKFIIHIIVFYENEIEQLFDTYYWITVFTNDIIIPNPTYFKNDPVALKKIQSEMLKVIDIKDENNYSTIYSKEQKIKLHESLNQ